jgi:DNA-binding transcriptional MerR regulator
VLRAEPYRVRAFADLSGVTVRTLHHYDQLGLLVPQRRGGERGDRRGYRVYTGRDLERLEQIVALRFLGFPLRQIKALLQTEPPTLGQALRVQQRLLLEQRRRLDRALGAIQAALRARAPDPRRLQRILRQLTTAHDPREWSDKYYSAAAKAKIDARAARFTPCMQAAAARRWAALFADAEAALKQSPRGAKARALAERWRGLVREFTQGDPEISRGLRRMWADRRNWPTEMQQRTADFKPEVAAYLHRAPRP